MFNNSFNGEFIGNNNGYPAPGNIGLNRYDYNSHLGRMVPVSSNGRFDYTNPIYDSFGRDMRSPLERNTVRTPNPCLWNDPLDFFKKSESENLFPSIESEPLDYYNPSYKINDPLKIKKSFKLW